MWEDPIVADVRRIREELSARFDFDVTAILDDIRARQTALGSRLVRSKRTPEAKPAEPADGRPGALHPGR